MDDASIGSTFWVGEGGEWGAARLVRVEQLREGIDLTWPILMP